MLTNYLNDFETKSKMDEITSSVCIILLNYLSKVSLINKTNKLKLLVIGKDEYCEIRSRKHSKSFENSEKVRKNKKNEKFQESSKIHKNYKEFQKT